MTETTREWVPGFDVEEVELERLTDPTRISIVLTGTEPPPPASDLAELLAQKLDRPITVEVVFVPIDVAHSEPE